MNPATLLLIEQILGIVTQYGPAGVKAIEGLVDRAKNGTAHLSDAELAEALDALLAELDATSADIASYKLPGVE